MTTSLRTTKETLEILGCARSTLTQHKEKLGIQPATKGNANFYTEDQVEQIKQSLESVPIQQQPVSSQSAVNQSPANDRTTNGQPSVSNQSTVSQQSDLLDHLKQEIDEKKREYQEEKNRIKQELKQEIDEARAELKKSQKEVQELSGQVGHWQGRAEAYQELNQKLLEQVKTPEPERETIIIPPELEKTEAEEAEIIIDAEIAAKKKLEEETEKNPTKISEESAEKRGFWSRLFNPL